MTACAAKLHTAIAVVTITQCTGCCDNWVLEHRPSVSVQQQRYLTNISKSRVDFTSSLKSEGVECNVGYTPPTFIV